MVPSYEVFEIDKNVNLADAGIRVEIQSALEGSVATDKAHQHRDQ